LFGIRATKLSVVADGGAIGINWADSLTAGLLHWFPLNENVGTKVIDVCGRCKTAATWTGAIVRTGSKFGRALEFPNSATNIDTGYSVKLPTNALTVSCWVRPSFAPAHWAFAVSAVNGGSVNDQFDISHSDNVTGGFKFGISNSSGSGFLSPDAAAVVENTWNHIVGVFDGATVGIYVNSVSGGSNAAVTTINNTNPVTLQFGDNHLANAYYAGGLTQVGIWNRALKPEEIRRLYIEPLAPLYLPGRPLFVPTIGVTWTGVATEAGVGSIAGTAVERMIGSTLRW